MFSDFIAGALCVWVALSLVLFIGHYHSTVEGVLRDEKAPSWPRVALACFLWPVTLLVFFITLALNYWEDRQTAKKTQTA